MAPFPETEIMTIKRIEVALRKMDLKLLKDGAYKLHEKFHSGFKFEFTDILKEIREEVKASDEITQDIKGILIPTIDDILASEEDFVAPQQNKVSSLTSLSYSTAGEPSSPSLPSSSASNTLVIEQAQQTPKIDAFSAFSTNTQSETQQEYTQSPFKVEPFKEFNTQEQMQEPLPVNIELETKETTQNFEQIEQIVQETQITQAPTEIQMPQQPIFKEQQTIVQENPIVHQFQEEKIKEETKTVAIYYHLTNSQEKIKNIIKYRELINKDDTNLNEILSLINEINTQSNVNVSELKTILEQLILKNNSVNLITNSSSSGFIYLLNSLKINFNIFDETKDEQKLNILPFLGLTNLFVCKECRQEYLEKETLVNSIIAQCPKCKSPMFPNVYAIKNDCSEINTDYYNSSLIALANSKVWLIVHPKLEDKTEINMLKTALKMSNKTKNIFIVDKDINVRENCKKMFLEIKNDLEINTQINVIEDFFKTVC